MSSPLALYSPDIILYNLASIASLNASIALARATSKTQAGPDRQCSPRHMPFYQETTVYNVDDDMAEHQTGI